jgi:hypothetical protein
MQLHLSKETYRCLVDHVPLGKAHKALEAATELRAQGPATAAVSENMLGDEYVVICGSEDVKVFRPRQKWLTASTT